MWIVLLMSALMLGTAVSFQDGSDETDSDEQGTTSLDSTGVDLDEPDIVPLDQVLDAPEITPTGDDSDDDSDASDPAADPIIVLPGIDTAGTDGADLFELGPEVADVGFDTQSVTGGTGDDAIVLTGPDGALSGAGSPLTFSNATIEGGTGNDTITASADSSLVSGDEGDDQITIGAAGNSTIIGGAGDDEITGLLEASSTAFIDGGEGNDTIDATQMDNVNVVGGAGDDTILLSGMNDEGAGYAITADGGAGMDRIQFDGSAVTDPDLFGAISVQGGADVDTFALNINEGLDLGAALSDDDPASLDVITLSDFEPGIDRIEIELARLDSDYAVAAARMEEDSEAGTTEVIVSYESDTDTNRELVVTLNATGVAWTDITFLGDDQPTELIAPTIVAPPAPATTV
jgi:hypothetical protein